VVARSPLTPTRDIYEALGEQNLERAQEEVHPFLVLEHSLGLVDRRRRQLDLAAWVTLLVIDDGLGGGGVRALNCHLAKLGKLGGGQGGEELA